MRAVLPFPVTILPLLLQKLYFFTYVQTTGRPTFIKQNWSRKPIKRHKVSTTSPRNQSMMIEKTESEVSMNQNHQRSLWLLTSFISRTRSHRLRKSSPLCPCQNWQSWLPRTGRIWRMRRRNRIWTRQQMTGRGMRTKWRSLRGSIIRRKGMLLRKSWKRRRSRAMSR